MLDINSCVLVWQVDMQVPNTHIMLETKETVVQMSDTFANAVIKQSSPITHKQFLKDKYGVET